MPVETQLAPAYGVQSALVEQPGKQEKFNVVLSWTQKFVSPALSVPHVSLVDAQDLLHQLPAQVVPLSVQSELVVQGSPTWPPETAQTNAPPPEIGWQKALANGAQSSAVLHPGKQENVFFEFWTHWFDTPAVFAPHPVSVVEAHVVLHHVLSQEPLEQAVHGDVDAVLHGSPMLPAVAAQMKSVVLEPAG